MGSLGRSDYTILGDNVNLAARLEGLNKLYGSSIIISKATKYRLNGSYLFRSLDMVRVKGKQEVVEVFEVLELQERKNREYELTIYAKALALYREGKISEAYILFTELSEKYTCTLYTLYLQRCQTYFDNPQKVFDMITTMLEK